MYSEFWFHRKSRFELRVSRHFLAISGEMAVGFGFWWGGGGLSTGLQFKLFISFHLNSPNLKVFKC